MTKNLLTLILAIGFSSVILFGQNPIKVSTYKTVSLTNPKSQSQSIPHPSFGGERCGTAIIHNHRMATDPVYKANYQQEQKNNQKTIADWKSGAKAPPPVYTVPIVYHVIHKGEAVGSGTNISDAQIQSTIDALNRDYRRNSTDGGIGQGAGPDTEIQFCLATKDPQGNPTTGINRVNGTSVSGYSSSGITSSNETQVKALSIWPNNNYLNIWIVSEIENNGADIANPNNWTGGTLAYAYLPGAPSSVDGIVVVNLCVGNDPQNNKGYRIWFATLLNRTLTHEIGHVMGLSHPFDDGNSSTCLDGDGLADTPPAKYAQNLTSCTNPVSQGACTNQNIAIYMDYTPEDCQNMFSGDETNVMRATLAGSRASLTTSSNTNCTTCTAATVTISSTNPSCTSNNGSATATATGGTSPYTYLWSNGGSTATINNLGAGTYTVTVTATGGCTSTNSVTLTIPGAPTATATSTNESAAGACDGTASVTVSGGTTPYTYQWSNSATTASISGLCAGTYTVTVTGNNSCSAVSTTSVSSPAPAGCDTISNIDLAQDTLVMYGISPQDCSGNGWGYLSGHNCWDDRAKADFFTATAGDTVTSAILYFGKAYAGGTSSSIGVKIWNGSSGTPGAVLGSVTVPISQLSTTQPVLVTFTPAIAVTGNFFCGIEMTANGTPQDTVALVTNQDGETMPGTAWEMWSDNTWHHDSSSWGVNLAHAIWVVKCTSGGTPNCTGFTATTTSTNPSCASNNGSATATATGGTTPYTYQWSNSATTVSITGLAAGTYTVTVTAANTCTATSSVTLSAPASPTVTTTGVNATNGCDGSATASASGGSTPYTYAWSNGGTSASVSGLCAGTYTVTVTGSNGCTGTSSVTITSQGGGTCDTLFYFDGAYYAPQVSDTAGFVFNVVDNDQKTPDSSLIAYGVTSNWQVYSEVVQPGDTNLFIGATSYFNPPGQADNWIMFGGVTIPTTGADLTWDYQVANNTYRDGYRVLINTTGPTLADFAAATVLKNVPDNDPSTNGDTVWTPNSVPITTPFVGQKVYIAFHHNANDQFLIFFDNITVKSCNSTPNCAGFTASATSTNPACGSSNGSATAVPAGGTSPYTYNWSNGATTSTISGLAVGTYTVTITAANSCTATASATLTSSGAPTVTVTSTSPTCTQNNGTATAAATGGTSPYTYLWSNAQATATATGLVAGTYSVTVTGANQCAGTQSVTLTASGSGPTLTVTSTNAGCGTNNGSATVSASGGITPYTYQWSNGGTTATISGLGAGTYAVTVTGGGCTSTSSATVTGGGNMTAVVSPQNTSCANTCNGQAAVAPSGGTTPYTYVWSNAANTATITGLCAGSYSVTVTDNAGCTVIKQTTISANSSNMFVSSTTTNATCNNPNGSATMNASGGSSPYTYSWNSSPVQSTNTATGLAGGNYDGIVTDANGCTDTVSVTVNNVGGVNANISNNPTICEGSQTTLVASGGTGFLWNPGGQTTNTITVSPTTTTTYYVTVTDNNQCSDTASATVTVNSIPVTTVTASDDTVCKGDTVMLVAAGGTSYFWNNGLTEDTIYVAPNSTTTYSVTAQNGNCPGNTATIKVNIFLPSPNALASSDVTTTYISQGGTVNFSSLGSTGTSFGWDFTGDGTIDATTASATYNYTAAGTYPAVLSVTFGNCTDYDTVYINVQNQPGTGINDSNSGNSVHIYPNPNNGKFQVNGIGFIPKKIEIFNVLGEKVYEQSMSALPDTWKIQLETSFTTGVYYVVVKAEDATYSRKITLINE